jgi:cytosine/uracil/thiamine/allantoin permease
LFSWNFLSDCCTLWLTMSSSISMKFSLITCRISSFRVLLWSLLGSLVQFIFVLLESGSGYPFSSFCSKSCTSWFLGENGFHPFFFFPYFH